ncbi:hypothetical protein, partial [Barnesiella intestinihominis]|uniref:hypothetical protein n=1 Tax=Barnesiella intestinihominis TaxID=487174 RepID=UPI003AB2E738
PSAFLYDSIESAGTFIVKCSIPSNTPYLISGGSVAVTVTLNSSLQFANAPFFYPVRTLFIVNPYPY